MTEMMDQLKPIADIVGPTSVKADYSQTQIPVHERHAGTSYRAGWKVTVNGTYKGAVVRLEKATTLDEAASKALAELRQALGLS